MQPLVSVIIPAHNEEECVAACIASLLRSDWPHEHLEILLIDHRSTDSTAEIARSSGANVISLASGKIGAVRNAGLDAAKGEFVAYVDADCTVPEGWLRTAINLLQSDQKIGAVGGPCLAPADGTWTERCLAPTHLPAGIISQAKSLATSSLITRTSLLRDLGKFDETLASGEDDDISNKLLTGGLTLISANDCHVVHHGYPQTWWSVLKKEIWHGSHHIEVRSKFDLTLILTLIFLFASAALPLGIISAALWPEPRWRYALLAVLILQITPPLLFTAKQISRSGRAWRLAIPLLATGYAYFAGHGFGVLSNLLRHVKRRPST